MHQVRYFLAVAQTLNFTRAAEQCNVAQPSLTRAVRKLEDELGGLLFHRERKNTHLTDLGRSMHPYLERTYLAAQAARDLARGIRSGEKAPLRVGYSTMVAPHALADLLDTVRMNVNGIELTLSQTTDRNLCEEAVAGEHDILFMVERNDLPDRMRSWTIFGQSRRLIMPQGHRFARNKTIDIAELDGEEIIDVRESGDRETILQMRAHTEMPPKFRHRVGGHSELQALVRRGFGLGLIPDGVPLIDGIVARPLANAELEHKIVVAIMAGRPFNRATEACLRIARSREW